MVDPAQAPYSMVGRVNFASTDTRAHCTGVLVSRRLALTAAHCLWNAPRARWIPAESLRFVSGYQHGQSTSVARITRVVLPPQLDPTAPFRVDPTRDWALLVLDQPLGDIHGHARLFSGKLRLAGPGRAFMPGYAGLTPHVLSVARDCGQPLAVAGRLMAACSAMPGDSGAPLFWQGRNGHGAEGLFLLGIATAVHEPSGSFTTDFSAWFRLRDALADEIAMGN